MTVASVEFYYPPVPQWKHLDRLAIDASTLDARELWTAVHDGVQEELAVLEAEVRESVAGVCAATGSTRGGYYLLFSYLTFSLPDSEVDPVVVGMTFTSADGGIAVEGDVSGEQTGDLISSAPNRMVPDSRNELLAAARESARELCQSANVIAFALRNPSRRVG
jgi:hypothetical protein